MAIDDDFFTDLKRLNESLGLRSGIADITKNVDIGINGFRDVGIESLNAGIGINGFRDVGIESLNAGIGINGFRDVGIESLNAGIGISGLRDTGIESLAKLSSFKNIVDEIAERVGLPDTIASSIAWDKKLKSQMFASDRAWLKSEFPSISCEGFATVSRLNQIVRKAPPFIGEGRELLNDDLGSPVDIEEDLSPEEHNEAHIKAGMNPSMLYFSLEKLDQVFEETGFIFDQDIVSTSQAIDINLTFNPKHNMLITLVEQKLRLLIIGKMSEKYGSQWTRRISANLLNEWSERQDQAVASGEAKLHLIHYSNFIELKNIILKKDHWREVFVHVFTCNKNFDTSMDRLHSVRLPIAHSRPLGVAQQLILLSESVMVLKALGINVLSSR